METREIKQEMRKRFDDRFNTLIHYEGTMKISHFNMTLGKIKFFIESEIDQVIAERNREIVEMIRTNFGQIDFNGVVYKIQNGKYEDIAGIQDIINLINSK